MRTLLPVAAVAFALVSAAHGAIHKASVAVEDAQIHLYPFATDDCSGQPFTSPYELKQGQCINMGQARSVRPRFQSEHADWIKETNALRTNCKLETFSEFNCPDNNRTEDYSKSLSGEMPENLEKCLVPERQQFQDAPGVYQNSVYSAKFICGKVEDSELLCSRTVVRTTWDINSANGTPTPVVKTDTYTVPLSATDRAIATVKRRGFEPNPKSENRSVYLKHPWSHSTLCYLCYTKKGHDYNHVECRSGINYPATCGPIPFGQIGRLKADVDRSTSTSDSEDDLPKLNINLQQKKSWHTAVSFEHPFIADKVACADAEWEKRGQVGKDYLKIQKVHICDKNDETNPQWISISNARVDMKNAHNHTVLRPKAATSVSSAAKTRRHDQL